MEKEFVCLSNEQIDDILNFIDSNFSCDFNKENLVKNATKLSDFLSSKNYSVNEADADILLDKSIRLNLLFSSLLKLDGFSKLLKINNISALVDMYCMRENIVFNIEDEKSTKDLNLYAVYMNDISQYQKLSFEEEHELALKAFNGDEKARELLVLHNLRFVVFLAHRHAKEHVSILDFIQFGNEGLIEASKKFDPYKEVRFITYAKYYICQFMSRGVLNTGRVIRVPVNIQLDFLKIKRATSDFLIQNNGVCPTDSDLAKILEMSESKIKYTKEKMMNVLSLSSSIFYDKNDIILLDAIEDPSPSLDEQANVEYLRNLVNKLKLYLSARELNIIDLLFGFEDDEMTLEAVGSIYGLSRERVRQIKNHALKRMKSAYVVETHSDRDSFRTYL